MELVAIVSILALIEYLVFSGLVGRERGRKGISAPATTGDPIFERYFRVHQNTLEQLVIFLPALWLFGWYVSPGVAAILGGVFLVARVLYLRGYIADPKKRGPGALLTGVTNIILMLGGLIGAALRLG